MAPTELPEGYGFVGGQDPATARALLDAADSIEADQTGIRTQSGGFLVPEDILDAYNEAAGADADGRPADSASKGDWVTYASTQGYDEAEGLTKAELIERFGATAE